MALVGNDLGDLLAAEAQASYIRVKGDDDGFDTGEAQTFWRNMAGIIVTYVQTNADIRLEGLVGEVTIPPGGSSTGLQISAAAGLPTTAPASDIVLEGNIE